MLATYSYDDRGRRTSLVMGDGTSTSYGYDDVSRLTSLGLDLDDGSTTTNDVTKTFTFNPAGQIAGQSVSNSLYIDPLPATVSTSFSRNNLNQPLHFGGSGVPDRDYTWNIRGTLTSEENTSTPHNTISYGYNNLNQLLNLEQLTAELAA